MTSDTWENAADPDGEVDEAPDPLLRPVWEAETDETEAAPAATRLGAGRAATIPRSAIDLLAGVDLPTLLSVLCDAQDALARLDARTAAASEAIREGLLARMAFAEAAGWLAHAHAWVHPLDLALRDLDLTGTYAVAATGGGPRVMPHTFAAVGPSTVSRPGWDEQTFDDMAEGDRAVADALALARLLRRLGGGGGRDLFATVTDAEATLAVFGAGALDALRFQQWREEFPPPARVPRRRFGRAGDGAPPSPPPLLLAARAAAAWMESGIADLPTPLQAGLAAVCLLAHGGPARSICAPVWAAYPAVGYGDRDALPGLRSDVAARIAGRSRGVGWPVVFLHLVAESARSGLRELDRLVAVAEQARALAEKVDRRSRLPDAVDAVLRTAVLTPKALAARLRVAPQTATALLRDLRSAGLAREVTGRGSFRAFAA
jgi:hypothetical protein